LTSRLRGAEIFPYLDRNSLRRAVVICHRNADADAYMSAYALSKLIVAIAPRCRVDVATPDGLTALTMKLAVDFPHKTVEMSEAPYDLYVAVDVGDTELLKDWYGKMSTSGAMRVLVDHHPIRSAEAYDHVIVDESATSAAEVVYGLFKTLGVPVRRKVAQGLLEGIMFDSSHLSIATEKTLRCVVELVDDGADLRRARSALRMDPDYGEVIAKLKGAKRCKIFRMGDWVVVTSQIGSFQAHVARAFVGLGVDFAAVSGRTDDETRVSLRSSQRFLEATKVHLGTDVAEPVSQGLGGHGGGHPTAASFSCDSTEDEATDKTLSRLSLLLGSEPREVD